MGNSQDTPSSATPSSPSLPRRTPVIQTQSSRPPQHPPHSAPGSSAQKFPVRIAVIAAIAVLVAVLLLFLLPGRDNGSTAMSGSLPTQRQMISDAKIVLSDDGIDCKVLDLEIDNDNLSERFKTYTADCTITISENGSQSERTLKLRYEYENDQWTLVR